MTTTVKVSANHGWNVSAQHVKPGTLEPIGAPVIVAAGNIRDYLSCHSGADLLIHEIQPGEQEAAAINAKPV